METDNATSKTEATSERPYVPRHKGDRTYQPKGDGLGEHHQIIRWRDTSDERFTPEAGTGGSGGPGSSDVRDFLESLGLAAIAVWACLAGVYGLLKMAEGV